MHRIASSLIVLSLLVPASASAAAAPRLELDARWMRIVEPWRYDEARRFEGGWNRGADVAPTGGAVRAPLPGRVRFVGSVAGRLVVTIDTRVAGAPVVVTMTGLDQASVQPGDRVVAGEIVGNATRLHVGAYDPARRSRYLPVVTRDVDTVAMEAGSVGALLADDVARRLAEAINGVARGSGDAASAAASDVGPASTVAPPSRVPSRSWPVIGEARLAGVLGLGALGPALSAVTARPVAVRGGSVLASPWTVSPHERRGSGDGSTSLGAGWPGADGGPTVADAPPHRVAARGVPWSGVGDARDIGAGALHRSTVRPHQSSRSVDRLGGVSGGQVPPSAGVVDGVRPVPGGDRAHRLPLAAGTVSPPVTGSRAMSVPPDGTEDSHIGPGDGGQPRRGSGRFATALGLGALAVALSLVRRRRRRRPAPPTPVHQPAPPVLPVPAGRPRLSVLEPPEPGAWPRVGSGTRTNDLQTPPTARARSPEHA